MFYKNLLSRCCAAVSCGFQMICMCICGPIIAILVIGLIVYFVFLRGMNNDDNETSTTTMTTLAPKLLKQLLQ